MPKETYIQIGVTALRDRSGNFLPSVPLYVKASDAIKGSGQTQIGEDPIKEIANLFAVKYMETRHQRGTSSPANA